MAHTLLLADDSPTIHRVIELTFADEDISVVSVDDGDKAIASLDRVRPDIVLADIGMPGRSGYEVARHVKETPALAHIPVLLLTGAFEPVDPAVVRAMRCEGVLTKPFEPRAVVRRVRELLQSPLSAEEPAAPAAPQPATVAAPAVFPGLRVVAPSSTKEPAPMPPEPMGLPDLREPAFPVIVPPRADADVETYFEELDQAFATLANPDRDPTAPPDQAAGQRPSPPAPAVAVPRPVSLTEAFTALLAAERTTSGGEAMRLASHAAPMPPGSTDDAGDHVVRGAVDGLSDEALRRIVEDVVQTTAERLIREEIERIKHNIK